MGKAPQLGIPQASESGFQRHRHLTLAVSKTLRRVAEPSARMSFLQDFYQSYLIR
jgi:hypothetical protein